MASLTIAPNQASATQNYNNYTDVNALNDLKKQARDDERSALRPVAEQFEALFVQQVLKEARKVSFDDGWLDGDSGDFYKDWYDKQLSQDLSAKGTLGFADKIVEQLAPKALNLDLKSDKNRAGMGEKALNPLDLPNQAGLPKQTQVSTTEQIVSLRQLKP
ncbi:MAG: rod-binding protein [Thiotrichales bacterium]|nr:rod-binding protein [Thiotrichales bacterium]